VRSEVFFDTHPVFTLDEFHAARVGTGAKLSTSKNLLAKHVASGRPRSRAAQPLRNGSPGRLSRGSDG